MRAPPGSEPGSWRPLLLAGIGVYLVTAMGVATAALTLSHSLEPEPFAAAVSRGLGREIHVETVALNLRPMPRVRLEGVVIHGLGTAEAAEVDVRFRPLLRGRVVPRTIFFEGLQLTLRRDADGGFEPLVPPRPDGVPFDWRTLPRVEAERGELRVVRGSEVSALIDLQALSISRFDEALAAELVLSGRIGGADHGWSLHPLHLRGRLVQREDGFAFEDGRLRARQAFVRWWSGRDVEARLRFAAGRVQVDALDVAAFGGRWHADGVVHFRGGTRLDLAVAIAGVEVAALFEAARPEDPLGDLGRIDTTWQLQVPWRQGPRFEVGRGVGQLTVHGGTLPTTSLGAKLSRGLGLSLGQRTTTEVESLSAPVALADGRIHSEAALLVTEDYALEAAGSVGLDRSLDLTGKIALDGLPDVPVTIAGALPHAEVQTHMARIPKNGIGAVARSFRKTGRALRGVLFGSTSP